MKVRTARGRGGAETVWTVCDDFAVGERPPPSPPFRRLRRRVRPSKLRLRTRFQAKKGGERKFSGKVLGGEGKGDVCCSKQGSKKARVKANVSGGGGGGRRETGKEGLSAPLS